MSRRGIVIAMAGASLFVCGCGGPPGAGTVNMSAIKAEAARRGVPEAKGTGEAQTGADRSPARARGKAPAKPLPKGGR